MAFWRIGDGCMVGCDVEVDAQQIVVVGGGAGGEF